MSKEQPLDLVRVAVHLREGAKLFRFRNADDARTAMEGRLRSDGRLGEGRPDFAEAVARNLRVLSALNRRRTVLRKAMLDASPCADERASLFSASPPAR